MVKVLGIGNRLMMDDGIAIAVLENIRDKLKTMGMEVIIGETDLQFCFHQLEIEDFVIILDATYSIREAGSIYSCRLEKAITVYGHTNSQHDMSLFDLMRLYSWTIRGYFIGIEVKEIGVGFGLSKTLSELFQDICFDIERLIKDLVKEVSYA
jgi:hydrogenase maturation protease